MESRLAHFVRRQLTMRRVAHGLLSSLESGQTSSTTRTNRVQSSLRCTRSFSRTLSERGAVLDFQQPLVGTPRSAFSKGFGLSVFLCYQSAATGLVGLI